MTTYLGFTKREVDRTTVYLRYWTAKHIGEMCEDGPWPDGQSTMKVTAHNLRRWGGRNVSIFIGNFIIEVPYYNQFSLLRRLEEAHRWGELSRHLKAAVMRLWLEMGGDPRTLIPGGWRRDKWEDVENARPGQ